MAINFLCTHCGNSIRVADSAGGKRAKCGHCGRVSPVPGSRKICAACSTDVTRIARFKDAEGNYFCEICWQAGRRPAPAAAAAESEAEGAAGNAAPAVLEKPLPTSKIQFTACDICGQLRAPDEMYQKGGEGENVCRSCNENGPPPPPPDVTPSELFCEGCGGAFPPKKLKVMEDHSVLCKKCVKRRVAFEKRKALGEVKKANTSGKSPKELAITAIIVLVVLVVLGRLVVQFLPKSVPAPAHPATAHP